MQTLWLLKCCLFILFGVARTSRILMLVPIGSPSLRGMLTPLARSLSKRGHEVMLASSLPPPPDRDPLPYTDVQFRMAGHYLKDSMNFRPFSSRMKTIVSLLYSLPGHCKAFLNDPAAEEILKRPPNIIILPAMFNECGLIFVKKFKVPFIYITTSGLTPGVAKLLGNPINSEYIPDQYLDISSSMSLLEKIKNFLANFFGPPLYRFLVSSLSTVAKDYLKDPSVSLEKVEEEVSLVFTNSEQSIGFARPLLPSIIEIGGITCREASLSKLSPELLNFLEDSPPRRTILVSFGSYIKSSEFPENLKKMLASAFAMLPDYKIIWKYEGKRPKNLTSNVLTVDWLPQQDLLGHPAVGAFLTHGGLYSLQEAVYHEVPIVGIPLLSDQYGNVNRADFLGIGIRLYYSDLDAKQIAIAFRILEESAFFKRISMRSKIMKDRETSPADKATFWVEHVLRHKGTRHLRSPALDVPIFHSFTIELFSLSSFTSFLILYLCISYARYIINRYLN